MAVHKGSLYTVFAPSGAGKTSLVKALIESDPLIRVSVSHTTRAQRPGEVDGVNYHFVDESHFVKMMGEAAFLEHAKVFNNYYGTSQKWVNDTLAEGFDVVLEIDWQGAQQTRRLIPGTIGVCILPPSKETLRERLKGRGQDSDDIIEGRMAEAKNEISHYGECDFLIVNEDFDQALSEFRSITLSQRLKLKRQSEKYQSLIESLLS